MSLIACSKSRNSSDLLKLKPRAHSSGLKWQFHSITWNLGSLYLLQHPQHGFLIVPLRNLSGLNHKTQFPTPELLLLYLLCFPTKELRMHLLVVHINQFSLNREKRRVDIMQAISRCYQIN